MKGSLGFLLPKNRKKDFIANLYLFFAAKVVRKDFPLSDTDKYGWMVPVIFFTIWGNKLRLNINFTFSKNKILNVSHIFYIRNLFLAAMKISA